MSGAPLSADVEVSCCVACGRSAQIILRTREEIDHELHRLAAFHTRRLVRRNRSSLEERATFTHDYPTQIVECVECGLLFRSPRPRADDVRCAYESDHYATMRLEQLRRSQLESFRSKARRLARLLRPGARVLEVGSFAGSFLEAAAEVGLEALGLDPGEQMATESRRRGLRVERTTLEEFATRSGARWDAICIWNTFDQLPHPAPVLGAAARLLVPRGMVVVRVPNGSCYRAWAKRKHGLAADFAFTGLAWNNLVGFPYLNGYSIDSLDRLMGSHGFVRREWHGDTLCSLVDVHYARWARLEESLWKTGQKLHALVHPGCAPWIEARYAAPATTPVRSSTQRGKDS